MILWVDILVVVVPKLESMWYVVREWGEKMMK